MTDSASGFAWQNAADAYSVQFPASLGAGPVRVAEGGSWVSFTIPGTSSTAGTVSGNAITYPGALPGVDITYTATQEGPPPDRQSVDTAVKAVRVETIGTKATLGITDVGMFVRRWSGIAPFSHGAEPRP